ncbi:hypothetical protein GCM10008090_30780 [Arenicella chitinivorans]|uniref:Uncharacterized protein n=1 Tax=Arenicella chitinivorans TaxID=1329800 RepID=A0A918S0S6_9GAMM|nr:hypothetical protein [Arenicella chitinivorans]GHA18949.1 hypothetical protein GCM10008090_30780 [Arenicella chitinivorans]
MKIVYIDMDDTLCNFKNSYKQSLIDRPEITWPHSQCGFFVHLEPLPQALETVNLLIESNKYDPYILTSPSVRNPNSYIEKRIWIEQYFGLNFCKKLIISPNKALNIGDYLIDDNVQGKGQENFQGELIHFGSKAFPNWESIARYLEI